MMGDRPGILSFASLAQFQVKRRVSGISPETLAALYKDSDEAAAAARAAFQAVKELAPVRGDPGFEPFVSKFPKSPFGRALGEIGWLIKKRPDIPLFVADSSSWDTHARQGAETGAAANLIGELSTSLFALSEALGADWRRVVVVAATEFGRTVAENGSNGTDHGLASLALVAGGKVRGGRFFGAFKGLKKEDLNEERDLPVTTDVRAVLSELLSDHLKARSVARVFPSFEYDPGRKLHLLES
jgi:uncharacterized protein (DUF1501 family)